MKIVVLRQLGGVGDCLMMSCVFRGLREKYPSAQITWVLSDSYMSGALVDLARHNPFVDQWFSIAPFEKTTKATRSHWNTLYGTAQDIAEEFIWRNADLTIDLNTACVEYEWPAMVTPEGIRKGRHEIWCERAEVTPSTYAPVYVLTPEEKAMAKAYRKSLGSAPVVALGMQAADPRRSLSAELLYSIAKGLRAKGFHVVTVDPTLKAEGFTAVVGKPFRDVIAILSEFDAMVTADSGLLHVAGAVDLPIIGIFGPTDPDIRMPLYRGSATSGKALVPCAPCWYGYPCLDQDYEIEPMACINKLNPEIIVHEVLRWVKKPSTPLCMV